MIRHKQGVGTRHLQGVSQLDPIQEADEIQIRSRSQG